ncbi:cation-transporting ATPase [Kingella kingae]|nr:cation-transporting ATPase [Kingella kingae]
MPTPLCTNCTRRSLSPCPSLNLIHYISSAGCFRLLSKNKKSSLHTTYFAL